MTIKDRLLLPSLISHIHSLGYKTLWIPCYYATTFLKIKDPGFDMVFVKPNYLQNPGHGWRQLSAAFARAKKHGAGMQVEFDSSALFKNSPGYRMAIDYLNRGLPSYDGYMSYPAKAGVFYVFSNH